MNGRAPGRRRGIALSGAPAARAAADPGGHPRGAARLGSGGAGFVARLRFWSRRLGDPRDASGATRSPRRPAGSRQPGWPWSRTRRRSNCTGAGKSSGSGAGAARPGRSGSSRPLVLAAAIWLGLVLGGYLPVPVRCAARRVVVDAAVNVIGVGIDLVDLGRRRAHAREQGRPGLRTLFTDDRARLPDTRPRSHRPCGGTDRRQGGRLQGAAVAPRRPRSIGWREIEVTRDSDGRPAILLHGLAARARRRARAGSTIQVSLTHSSLSAGAVAVVERLQHFPNLPRQHVGRERLLQIGAVGAAGRAARSRCRSTRHEQHRHPRPLAPRAGGPARSPLISGITRSVITRCTGP